MAVVTAGQFKVECRAVLFDKDGTLLDFKSMWLEWARFIIRKILARVNGSLSASQLEYAIGVDLAGWRVIPASPMARGTLSGIKEALYGVMTGAGLKRRFVEEVVDEAVEMSVRELKWGELARPLPGVRKTLKKLRGSGLKMAVVTADNSSRAREALEAQGLVSYFDAVIGADEVKQTKPAPDLVILACRRLGVRPTEAVVVGDNVSDMIMGRRAGAAAVIGVLTGVWLKEHLSPQADVVIGSVAELEVV